MLRTIGNNFANAAKQGGEIEYSVGGVTKSLSLLDKTTGDLKPTFEIFKDLKSDWDNMTNAEKQAIAITYAGKTQFEVFSAVMNNFSTALKATEAAYDSAGSAARENENAMDSLEKKIDLLKAAYENFASSTITKDFIGSILDAGTSLLNFANTDMGVAVTKALLFGTTLGSAAGFLGTFTSKIGEAFKAFKLLKSGADLGIGAIGALSKAKWTVIALGIAGITAAAVLLVQAFKNVGEAYEKHITKAENLGKEVEKYSDDLSSAKKKLDDLNKTPASERSSEWEAEKQELEQLVKYYEDLIELKKQERAEEARKAARAAEREGLKTGIPTIRLSSQDLSIGETDAAGLAEQLARIYPNLDASKVAGALSKSYSSIYEAVDAFTDVLNISRVASDGSQKSIEDLQEELRGYGIIIDDTIISIADATQKQQELANSINNTKIPTQDQLKLAEQQIKAGKDLADAYRQQLEAGDTLTDEQSKWLLSYQNLEYAYESGKKAADEYNAVMKSVKEAFGEIPSTAKASEESITALAQSLIRNADLGITSIQDLKGYLQQLADAGIISFDKIDGGLEGFIARLLEANGIQLDDKTADITVNDDDLQATVDEANGLLNEIEGEHQITVTSQSEAEGLRDALTELKGLIDQVNGKSISIKINVDTSSAQQKIDSITSGIKEQSADIAINVTGDQTTAIGNLSQIQTIRDSIMSMPNISVTVNAITQNALNRLVTIRNYSIPNKSFYVSAIDNATSVIENIRYRLNSLPNQKVIYINAVLTGNGASYLGGRASGTDWAAGGNYLINDGSPVNGSPAELVVSNGVGRIYNDGKPTIQNLPQGAKVYTAAETQKILQDQDLSVDDLKDAVIPAFADGTKNNKYPDYRFDPSYSGVTTLSGSGEELKKNFDEWLKEKKHYLNMDVITEAQYYRDLEIMNERYLKNMAEYRDDYWSHEEEIYNWRNQSLEKQIELEEKLSDLAKAKSQTVLAFTGGRFQYIKNIDAIAAAQREVDRITGHYADGTTNARGGLSLVGEEGPELRVLKNGDGIIPADGAKNLMALSRFNPKDILSAAKSSIVQYAFDISNISLPNVKSAEDFIDGLRNMAYQYSFSRA